MVVANMFRAFVDSLDVTERRTEGDYEYFEGAVPGMFPLGARARIHLTGLVEMPAKRPQNIELETMERGYIMKKYHATGRFPAKSRRQQRLDKNPDREPVMGSRIRSSNRPIIQRIRNRRQ